MMNPIRDATCFRLLQNGSGVLPAAMDNVFMWDIQLLGGLVLRSSDRVVTRFRYHKAGSLLAYLAYFNTPRTPPRSREALIDMLWPDASPETGQKNLRNVLSALRPILEPPGIPPGAVLKVDRFTVQLNPAAIACDVHEFEQAARKSLMPGLADAERVELLLKATQSYHGQLAPGYFEEWIGREAVRMNSLFMEVALQAAPLLLDRGRLDQATDVAQKAVASDPTSEPATLMLMRVFVANRQPSHALRVFRLLERKLLAEWQEVPSDEILAYARQIRKSPGTSIAPAPLETDDCSHASIQDPAGPSEPGNILSPTAEPSGLQTGEVSNRGDRLQGAAFALLSSTRFFGREVEIGRLIQMLCTPRTRLITITGPGGVGKTRLALESVSCLTTRSEMSSCRALFAALADVADPMRIGEAVLHAVGARPIEDIDPLDQVCAALAVEQSIVLVLDNFEHLADEGASVVGELLARIPQLKCLVTSRQKLLLEGEHEFLLSPLPTSGGAQTPEALQGLASIALFVDRAQMVRPDFQVTPHNAATLAEICDKLEGMPLAIELAAPRVQLLTLTRILEQIHKNRLGFLVTRRRDGTSRQRTLRSTLDWSFHLLSEPARELLAVVSVFRGGWTFEAAQSVCLLSEEDTLELLGLLRDNSLVQVVDEDEGLRFTLLETVRDYAAEHLQRMGRQEEIRRRHAEFFRNLAESEGHGLSGPHEPEILRKINAEQENLRAAVAWTTGAGEVVLRAQLSVALFNFWIMMGYGAEYRQWLSDLAVGETGGDPGAGADIPPLLYAWVLFVLGRCARIQGDPGEAAVLYRKSLKLFEQEGDAAGMAEVLLYQGIQHTDFDLPGAEKLFEASLQLMRRTGNETGISLCLLGLTRIMRSMVIQSHAEYERAYALCAEARKLCLIRGDLHGLADILVEEGSLARAQHAFPRATQCLEENLALRRQIGDRPGIGKALNYLGHVAREAGDLEGSLRHLEEAIWVLRDCQWGSSNFAAQTILNLAKTRHSLGENQEAEALAKQSLKLYRRRGARSGYHQCLRFIAQLVEPANELARIARLIGAAEAMRAAHGAGLEANESERLAHMEALVVKQLGADGLADEKRAGSALSDDEAISLALGDKA